MGRVFSKQPPHRMRKQVDPIDALLEELYRVGTARLSIISGGRILKPLAEVALIQKEKHMKAIEAGEVDICSY